MLHLADLPNVGPHRVWAGMFGLGDELIAANLIPLILPSGKLA